MIVDRMLALLIDLPIMGYARLALKPKARPPSMRIVRPSKKAPRAETRSRPTLTLKNSALYEESGITAEIVGNYCRNGGKSKSSGELSPYLPSQINYSGSRMPGRIEIREKSRSSADKEKPRQSGAFRGGSDGLISPTQRHPSTNPIH